MVDRLFSIGCLREGVELEAKRAAGRDGKGALPKEIWETYSAFANTDGGVILLGVSEDDERGLVTTGIEEPKRVLDELWQLLEDPRVVSHNLLSEEAVKQFPTEDGRWVIAIDVPRASRENRPVFIGGDPLTGSYHREDESDCRFPVDEIHRMMAEQGQASQKS